MYEQSSAGETYKSPSKPWFIRWRWYLRYTIALAIVAFAALLVTEVSYLWPIAAFLVLDAAVLARELSLLLVTLGVLWLVYKLLAALPVSVAIILGALIIATGIARRGGR